MTLATLLVVAAAVFAIGLFGVLARRHAIGVLLSIELMFNAVNLAIISIAWSRGCWQVSSSSCSESRSPWPRSPSDWHWFFWPRAWRRA